MSSPPPPTPPPPPSSPSSYTSFPILAISILGILTTAILLVSYYVFVIKCCLNWRRADDLTRLATSRSRRRRRGSLTEDPSPFTFYASTAAEPRGLEESAIQAIPIIRFRKTVDADDDDDDDKDKKKSPTGFFFHECAVCLTEFADGERVRLLPNCSHAFHIDCIDTWLQTNSNCPLCRSEISSGLIPSEHFMAHFPIQIHHDSFVIDVRDDGVGGSTGRHPTSEPTPTSTTGRQNQSSPSPRKLQERRWTEKKGRKLQHQSSMGDECIDVRKQDERFPSVQPIRRSISMDSSTDRQLYIAVQEILRQQRSSQDASAAAAIGEGSSSGAGGGSGRLRRAFFSFGRSSRNAVLPIQFDP